MNIYQDNLIPCDRCGKTNVKFYARPVEENEHWWRFSHRCSVINVDMYSGYFDTEQEAIDAWNYRTNRQEQ